MKGLHLKSWSLVLILALTSSTAFAQMTRQFSLSNPTPGRPDYVDVVIVDLDGDGNLDVYAVEESVVIGGSSSVEVEDDQFMNDGNGILSTSFTKETLYQSGLLYDNVNAADAEAADFDDDGNMDIVRVSSKRIFVLYTDANGDWDEAIQYNISDDNNNSGCSTNYVDVEVADFNDDGLPDFVVAQDNNCGCNPVFENDGNRAFTRHCNSGDASNTKSVSTGDINCDGDIDLLYGHSWRPIVLTGNGDFTFSTYFTITDVPGFDFRTVTADFAHVNGDGGCSGSSTNSGLDIYIVKNNLVNGNHNQRAYKKETFGYNRKWSKTISWLASDARFERNIVTNAEGLKDNGKTELVVVGQSNSNMNARRVNSGFDIINISSTFLSAKTSGAGIDFGDLDNDGDLDMVIASGSTVTFYENDFDDFTTPAPFTTTTDIIEINTEGEDLTSISHFPIPVAETGTFQYHLGENNTDVLLEMYDLNGTKINTMVNKVQQEGDHQISFETTALSAGVYIYHFKAGKTNSAGKLVVSK